MKALKPGRSRSSDIDRLVGLKLREQRLLLGLTQQQMGELIGVTYQQAHKYEKGMTRLPPARLYQLATALKVEITYFFPAQDEGQSPRPTEQQRRVMALIRNVLAITDPHQQQSVCNLARALADSAPA